MGVRQSDFNYESIREHNSKYYQAIILSIDLLSVLQDILRCSKYFIFYTMRDNDYCVNHIPSIDRAFINGFRQSVRSTEKM